MDFGEVLGFVSAMVLIAEPRSVPVLPECLWAGRSPLLHRCSKVTLVNAHVRRAAPMGNQPITGRGRRKPNKDESRLFTVLVVARILEFPRLSRSVDEVQ